MKNILDLNTNSEGKLILGQWLGQWSGSSRSYMVKNETFEKMQLALDHGKTVMVGNAPRGDGDMISRVNSRYHGWSIRTIRVK